MFPFPSRSDNNNNNNNKLNNKRERREMMMKKKWPVLKWRSLFSPSKYNKNEKEKKSCVFGIDTHIMWKQERKCYIFGVTQFGALYTVVAVVAI